MLPLVDTLADKIMLHCGMALKLTIGHFYVINGIKTD